MIFGLAMDQIMTWTASTPCKHAFVDATQLKQRSISYGWVSFDISGTEWLCRILLPNTLEKLPEQMMKYGLAMDQIMTWTASTPCKHLFMHATQLKKRSISYMDGCHLTSAAQKGCAGEPNMNIRKTAPTNDEIWLGNGWNHDLNCFYTMQTSFLWMPHNSNKDPSAMDGFHLMLVSPHSCSD